MKKLTILSLATLLLLGSTPKVAFAQEEAKSKKNPYDVVIKVPCGSDTIVSGLTFKKVCAEDMYIPFQGTGDRASDIEIAKSKINAINLKEFYYGENTFGCSFYDSVDKKKLEFYEKTNNICHEYQYNPSYGAVNMIGINNVRVLEVAFDDGVGDCEPYQSVSIRIENGFAVGTNDY